MRAAPGRNRSLHADLIPVCRSDHPGGGCRRPATRLSTLRIQDVAEGPHKVFDVFIGRPCLSVDLHDAIQDAWLEPSNVQLPQDVVFMDKSIDATGDSL